MEQTLKFEEKIFYERESLKTGHSRSKYVFCEKLTLPFCLDMVYYINCHGATSCALKS